VLFHQRRHLIQRAISVHLVEREVQGFRLLFHISSKQMISLRITGLLEPIDTSRMPVLPDRCAKCLGRHQPDGLMGIEQAGKDTLRKQSWPFRDDPSILREGKQVLKDLVKALRPEADHGLAITSGERISQRSSILCERNAVSRASP
jgi:hypothetical protein